MYNKMEVFGKEGLHEAGCEILLDAVPIHLQSECVYSRRGIRDRAADEKTVRRRPGLD